ncbi:hypothetical protein U9M48_004517 [Paspalum notatum var. saurae]|uniref:F-box domain-containing protein n=1 Tax=Paspalum notatum var. saurae TaxID=547442 RepID=A0AAQ3PUX8_PASNO
MDAHYEILLRLPAKGLCRLRAVCRPWRSLRSDPRFIAAHAARHPGLLIVAGHDPSRRDEGILCDILDLAGRVIKRIRSSGNQWVMSTNDGFACVAKGSTRSCQLLNLATGDVSPLPEGVSEEHEVWAVESLYGAVVVLGQVASTGEYKLLPTPYEKACELFTLGSGSARWRGKKAAAEPVSMLPLSRVVMDGIVYFLFDEAVALLQRFEPRAISSFDFSTEEWRPNFRGPVNNFLDYENADYDNLSLTALNGSLVVAHHSSNCSMDLWFLMDSERSLWVKQHSVQVDLRAPRDEFCAHPVLMLNDGRIITYVGSGGLLRIYNPRTNAHTDVAELGPCVGVDMAATARGDNSRHILVDSLYYPLCSQLARGGGGCLAPHISHHRAGLRDAEILHGLLGFSCFLPAAACPSQARRRRIGQ